MRVVAQPFLRDAIHRRRRDHAAERARHAEARVVGDDEENVRRTLRRHDARRPPRLRLQRVVLDHAAEFRIGRRKLRSADRRRCAGGSQRAGDLLRSCARRAEKRRGNRRDQCCLPQSHASSQLVGASLEAAGRGAKSTISPSVRHMNIRVRANRGPEEVSVSFAAIACAISMRGAPHQIGQTLRRVSERPYRALAVTRIRGERREMRCRPAHGSERSTPTVNQESSAAGPATPKVERRISPSEESLVGVRGFEPPTSCSQSKRATGLRYTPSG